MDDASGGSDDEAKSPSASKKKFNAAATMLAGIKQRGQADSMRLKEAAEARAREMAKIYHPTHSRLEACLSQSARLGPPLRVRVTNESYWHRERRALGGANHMARELVRTEDARHGVRYEGFYYRLMPHASDASLAPERTSAGDA